MNYWEAIAWSIAPTLIVSALFFFILRSVVRAVFVHEDFVRF